MKKLTKSATNIISPRMIQTDTHWFNSFGKQKTEISARLFVKACKKNNKWTISRKELDNFDSTGDFWFNGLAEPSTGWIEKDGNNYTATHKFIAHVFSLFPV